jgi:hypothetical protein
MFILMDVYAHKISDSDVHGDAYYNNISNVLIYGQSHPGSSDEPFAKLPISDKTINGWENDAKSASVYNGPCPYNPSSTTVTLGNIEINCDLVVKSSAKVILTGPVWVNGSISLGGGASISIDPSLGAKSIPLIADEKTNDTSGGVINANGSLTISGSGTKGSYVMLVSQNNNGEGGGSKTAINIGGGVSGALILYAPHGNIDLSGGVDVHQITGYSIRMSGGATLTYEDGLKSVVFPGAQGSWSLSTWKEVN